MSMDCAFPASMVLDSRLTYSGWAEEQADRISRDNNEVRILDDFILFTTTS
jgi:hypothetical protein